MQHKTDDWCIDSGATSHMSNYAVLVGNLKKPERSKVTAADGKEMNIIGMCDIKKRSLNGSEMTLKNVHIVPEICTNLLSVSQIHVLHDNVVTFDKKGCRVTDVHGEVIATGRLENGLFKLNVQGECANAFVEKKK